MVAIPKLNSLLRWFRAEPATPTCMGSSDDVREIELLIARQFASLNWTTDARANWDDFASGFFSGASLYPAARPAKRQTVEAFVERMKRLSANNLRSFHETVLGTEVRVFGNVAVAIAACEMTENGTETTRAVEMMLLIKSDGGWQIVSQAWDQETELNRVPAQLTT
jgi:hypothetical protein